MQDGVRGWVLRAARDGGNGLRKASPPVLLSLLCASAFSPLLAVSAGIAGTAALAGAGVLSSVGGGALTGVIVSALDRLRRQENGRTATQGEVEQEIARQIQEALAAGGAAAQALHAELAAVLQEIDAGGTALRQALDTGNEQVRSDVVAAIGGLSAGFAGMQFLLGDVSAAAGEILAGQDAHGAQLRAVMEKVDWAATEARMTREETAAWRASSAGLASAGTAAGPRWLRGCPYRGLQPFSEADAEVFYGRERLTAELAGKVSGRLAETGILVVTGASGAGKSSLLRAGLLPALARGQQVPRSAGWPRLVITPTRHPVAELATHLAVLCGTEAPAVQRELAGQPDQAHVIVRQAVITEAARRAGGQPMPDDGERLVLIVDQFEQVFTLNPDGEPERRAFIAALCAAASNPAGPGQQPPALVVIAVRGDFWDRCAAYPELAEALRNGQFVVGPMTDSELRLAITGPAQSAGLQIDPVLTDAILSDLQAAGGNGTAGVLPLLSQAMLLTWDRRDGNRLTSHGYSLSGGVSHAVQTSADSVYDALPAGQQALARELLRAMTVASRDGRLTRRPVSREGLYAQHATAARTEVDAVLDAFAGQRLIVLDGDIAQIAHDALLTAWPRLRGWLEDDLASWALHAQLADDTAAWDASGMDTSFLYRGTQLAAFRQAILRWSASPGRYPALTGAQRGFMDASERGAVRSGRQRRILVGALILLLIASLAGAGIAAVAARSADHAAATARQQRDLAASGQLAAQSEALDATDPVTASLLAAAAWHFDSTRQARDSLLDAAAQPEHGVLNTGTGPIRTLAFSPDGRILATATAKDVVLWDTATSRQIGSPLRTGSGVIALAYSPGGRYLATASDKGTARLWAVATHEEVGAPLNTGHASQGTSALAFGPGGPILATTQFSGDTTQLWDVTTRRPIGAPLATGSPISLTFSANGKLLGVTTAAGAQVWSVAAGIQLDSPPTVAGLSPDELAVDPPDEVVFSPNGRILATASGSGVALSDAATGRQVGSGLLSQGGMYQLAAFNTNGQMLATADGGGTIRLWDVADHQQVGVLAADLSPVQALAFSPAGKVLATANEDGQVQLWDVAIWRQIGAPLAVGDGLNNSTESVAASPDDQTLAIGEGGGAAQLWDTATQRRLGDLAPATATSDAFSAVAFSPSGRTLAVGDGGNTVQLWDVATRRETGKRLRLNVMGGILSFSPDGKMLAAASGDSVRLVNIATGRPVSPPLSPGKGAANRLRSFAFSPDGKTLATVTTDAAQLWDTATHRKIDTFRIGQPFVAGDSYKTVGAVAFSPSGNVLAAATSDTVHFWDMTLHRQIGAPLNLNFPPSTLAFSPNGQILAAGSVSTVTMWDVNSHQPIGAILSAPADDSGGFSGLVFSPGGTKLVANDQQAAYLWDVRLPKNLVRAACSTAGHILTRQEWNIYIPSEPFKRICG
jgi:WD40 repeat protein